MKTFAFITEKEAMSFIAENFPNAIIKASYLDSRSVDENNIPFTWDGEAFAYNVNHGEAIVGYLEPKDSIYTLTAGNVSRTFDSLYAAREAAKEWAEIIRDEINASCEIKLVDNDGEECDADVENPVADESLAIGDLSELERILARKEIGEKIRVGRMTKGMSIRDLAKAAGMSKNNVLRIEQGLYNYTIDSLTSISKVLGIELSI